MPSIGYKQTELHRKRLSDKAKLRGNNGWLNRQHTDESKKKMCRPHSPAHIARIRATAVRRWAKYKEVNKPAGVVIDKWIEPDTPINIDYDDWDGIKDIL